MKNVLITGVAGFLGSHLALYHLEKGDKVYGYDNFSTALGDISNPSAHFKRLLEYDTFEFHECDISGGDGYLSSFYTDSKSVSHRLRVNFDLIYNMACPASPPRYQEMPIQTMLTCVQGVHNILRLAYDNNAILVHASTSEVYGDPVITPQPETYKGSVNSYGPRACYDEGKRAAEALCYDYKNKYGVDARLVRIFNTYGPHMDPEDGRVVSNFICQAIQGKPITVYGNGAQTRSFCYVDDLIRAIIAMGELKHNPGTPINIGNPQEFTILQLAEELQRRFGVDIIFKPLPIDDPMQRCPDITLARKILSWQPEISLVEGLDYTVEYFDNILKAG